MKIKTYGSLRDITFRYNSYLNDVTDKTKISKDSKGEIIDNRFINNNYKSDTDSESTVDSNKPSYIEQYENCTKIISNLENQCI